MIPQNLVRNRRIDTGYRVACWPLDATGQKIPVDTSL